MYAGGEIVSAIRGEAELRPKAIDSRYSGFLLVLSAGLLVGALLVLAPRPARSAEGVALGYEGYLGGLHMLTAEVQLVRNAKRYRMETVAEGRGLLSWFIDWRSTALTEGAVVDGVLRPELHRRDISQSGRRPKAIQIEYRDDGVPLVARMRVGDQADFAEAEERRGTMDPMSAVAAIVDQMTAGTECAGTFAVFDGKWRYDVAARKGDSRTLKGNKYMMYHGDAARCDLILTPIDGFEDDDKPRGSPRQRETPQDDTMALTMWFASPGDGLPSVPVMATANTDYGGLRIYLARAQTAELPTEGQRASAR